MEASPSRPPLARILLATLPTIVILATIGLITCEMLTSLTELDQSNKPWLIATAALIIAALLLLLTVLVEGILQRWVLLKLSLVDVAFYIIAGFAIALLFAAGVGDLAYASISGQSGAQSLARAAAFEDFNRQAIIANAIIAAIIAWPIIAFALFWRGPTHAKEPVRAQPEA